MVVFIRERLEKFAGKEEILVPMFSEAFLPSVVNSFPQFQMSKLKLLHFAEDITDVIQILKFFFERA